MHRLHVLSTIACAMLSGCASTLQVTYRSEPSGATIYEGERQLGRTPALVTYQATDSIKAGGCQQVLPADSISKCTTVEGNVEPRLRCSIA